jgi:NAD(P)-dependent dehydrogenase (short-subunit alcohol dehydrogenase family)
VGRKARRADHEGAERRRHRQHLDSVGVRAEPDVSYIRRIWAALAVYTKIFVNSSAADNVRMNNVLPGWIDTLPAVEERRQSVPMDRYGTANEVAAAIAFLASESASYITGQSLRVDGGITRSV